MEFAQNDKPFFVKKQYTSNEQKNRKVFKTITKKVMKQQKFMHFAPCKFVVLFTSEISPSLLASCWDLSSVLHPSSLSCPIFADIVLEPSVVTISARQKIRKVFGLHRTNDSSGHSDGTVWTL